jgi:branched-chain amino acid transport system substrate-binding protein
MRLRIRSIPAVIAGTVATLGLALAGCDSASSGAASPAGGATSPIVVGTEMPLTGQQVTEPELKAGMEAAVSDVNAVGGIDGHPLQLKICDTQFDPNLELTCMRNLISDKVTAIVGGLVAADQSGREFQLASQAGIPVIGGEGTVPAEFTTPGVFPISSGFVGWVYGGIEQLITGGAKKIGVVGIDNASGLYGVKLGDEALAAAGMKPVTTAIADPQADPTFSTAAAKAIANGADALYVTMIAPDMPKILTALRNAGYHGLIATLTDLATPAIIKAAGPAAEGMLVTGHAAFATETANPGIKTSWPT